MLTIAATVASVAPMAMPTSAADKAARSFMPSPQNMAVNPKPCRRINYKETRHRTNSFLEGVARCWSREIYMIQAGLSDRVASLMLCKSVYQLFVTFHDASLIVCKQLQMQLYHAGICKQHDFSWSFGGYACCNDTAPAVVHEQQTAYAILSKRLVTQPQGWTLV